MALYYGAGGSGMVQVWIDGEFVGQHELSGGLPRPITTASPASSCPHRPGRPASMSSSVMVRNNGHNWDLDADDFHKEARGLVSASVEAPGGRSFAVPIAWKIQGGAAARISPIRCAASPTMAACIGEREGWHLPGFDDRRWARATLPATQVQPGTTWYRTASILRCPRATTRRSALAFGDTTTPRSPNRYRVLIFVNGWNMGQFIAHVGPQRLFPSRGHPQPSRREHHRAGRHIDGAPGNALEPSSW